MFRDKQLTDVTMVVDDSTSPFTVKKSILWNHFTKVENYLESRKCKCNICGKLVSNVGGSTTGMKKHMEIHHENELKHNIDIKQSPLKYMSKTAPKTIWMENKLVNNRLENTSKPYANVLKSVLDFLYLGTTEMSEDCALEVVNILDMMKTEINKNLTKEGKIQQSGDDSTIKGDTQIVKLPKGIEIITNEQGLNLDSICKDNNDFKFKEGSNNHESLVQYENKKTQESTENINTKTEVEPKIEGFKQERENLQTPTLSDQKNSTYFCSECHYHSFEARNIVKHKKVFSHQTFYQCTVCGDKMPVNMMKRHKFVHREKNHFCDQCDKKYYSFGNLHEHYEGAHSDKMKKCSECDTKYTRGGALRRHKKKTHDKESLLCTECPFKGNNYYMTKHNLKEHAKDLWFKCTFCDYSHWDKIIVKGHIERIHEQKRIKCDLCNATFSNVRNMHAHVTSIHRDILIDTGNFKVNDPFWNKYTVAEQVLE